MQVQYVEKPTASHINYKSLHPNLYQNLSKIADVNQLAQLLGAPANWQAKYNDSVLTSSDVWMAFNDLLALANSEGEHSMQATFSAVVFGIANSLKVHLRENRETKLVVGGILACSEYDIRSQTDPYFINNDDETVLASEVKTSRTFGHGHWFHGSRSTQVFTALFPRRAPTVLLNQKQWKLFVENENRTAVFTFPFEEDDPDDPGRCPFLKSTLVRMMGTTLVRVICICVLAKPGRPPEEGQDKPPPSTPPTAKNRRRGNSAERLSKHVRLNP